MKPYFLFLITLLISSLISLNSHRITRKRISIYKNLFDSKPVLGGYGHPKPSDNLSRKMIRLVKEDLESTLDISKNEAITIKQYSVKVVAGAFYKIEFKVAGSEYEAIIFAPLPHTHQPPVLEALTKLV